MKKNIKFNKKKIEIILLVLAGLLLLIGTLFLIFRPKNDLPLNEVLDNMINTKNYKVSIKLDEKSSNTDEIYNSYNYENMFDNNKEMVNLFDFETESYTINYVYDGKLIISGVDDTFGQYFWHYDREESKNNFSFREIYNNLYSILKMYKYSKKKSTFHVIDEKKSSQTKEIISFLEKMNFVLFEDSEHKALDESLLAYEKTLLNDIVITLKNDKLEHIKFVFIQKCYDSNNKEISNDYCYNVKDKYEYNFEFTDFDTTKVEIPDNVKDDLQKTTPPNVLGKFENSKVCPDGDKYVESIELTDDYTTININHNRTVFWYATYTGFDCEKKEYYTNEKIEYSSEGGKIYFYDSGAYRIVTEFDFTRSELREKDESGNVVNTFIKIK